MPGNPIFSKLFGRSPIAPLQEHMNVAADCAARLSGYFETVFVGDWDAATTLNDVICDLEEQADVMKREIRLSLPRSLFLPVPRSDLLEMLQMQDRIPNRTKDIAGLILGRKMNIPAEVQHLFAEFIQLSIAATALCMEVLNELDELIVSGFSGQEIDLIEKMLIRLGDVEHESDIKQIAVRRKLLSIEGDLNPVNVMFLYRIIDWIGDLADDSQTVGNRMLYLIAR